jgi:hypothetical protein
MVSSYCKHQMTSTKSQISSNAQYSKRFCFKKFGSFGDWKLGFVWDLWFGIWNLELRDQFNSC